MSLPNYPNKHDAESVFTATGLLEGLEGEVPTGPPALILCFQDRFFEHLIETHTDGEELHQAGAGKVYQVSSNVAVAGDFGIGSAITAAVIEEQAACGAETICILGGAGCLDPNIPPDEAIIATRAIRDEGASYHYLPPAEPATPTSSLRETIADRIRESNIPVHQGPTWTIDAIYRETVPEVKHYAGEGVLTAEMEAATLFAVAEYHDLDAAAVFSIGDYTTPDDREVPDASHSLLPELFEPTVAALEQHVE